MIASIIGCGPSGKYWNGEGFSIGVNDAFKWGNPTDILIVVNSLDNYPDRKQIVMESRPKQLLALGTWSSHPSYKHIPYMNQWKGVLEKGKLYKSKTSPFIAVTLAYSMGYDKIVLYGVDFIGHPIVKGSKLRGEITAYESLQKALIKNGASMYLGGTDEHENDGVFKDLLPSFKWVSAQ